MPIHACTKDGKPGRQWGGQKCYVGAGAHAKAARQAGAAYAHGYEGHGEETPEEGRARILARFFHARHFCEARAAILRRYSEAKVPVRGVTQDSASSCGAAAAMSAARLYKVGPADLDSWKKALGTDSEDGTRPDRIVSYLKHLGLQVEAREHMSLEDLAEYVRRGWPVIVAIQEIKASEPEKMAESRVARRAAILRRFSEDAKGHEHKEKGQGGGQFTSKGGGGGGSAVPGEEAIATEAKPEVPATAPAAAPAAPPAAHAVQIHPDAQVAAKKLFGRELASHELAALACAPAGSQIQAFDGGGKLHLSSSKTGADGNDVFSSSRTIAKGWLSPLTCKNITFALKGESKGQGLHLFEQQVKGLQSLGVKKVACSAAGGPSGGGNGFYTWPRFGYSGPMSENQVAALPDDIRKSLGKNRDIQDLFDLPGGAEAWKQHGSGLPKLTFDLTPGSRNWQALEKYKTARGEKEWQTTQGEKNSNGSSTRSTKPQTTPSTTPSFSERLRVSSSCAPASALRTTPATRIDRMAEWQEEKHPRGGKNPGQFAKKGTGKPAAKEKPGAGAPEPKDKPAPKQIPGDTRGHYVVVTKTDLKQGHVTVEDSAGKQAAEKKIDAKQFLAHWHDKDASGSKFVRYGIAVGPPQAEKHAEWDEHAHHRDHGKFSKQDVAGATAEHGKKPPSEADKETAEAQDTQPHTPAPASPSAAPAKDYPIVPPGHDERDQYLASAPAVDRKPIEGGINGKSLLTLPDGTRGIFKPADEEVAGARWGIDAGTYYLREACFAAFAQTLGKNHLAPRTVVRKDEQTGQVGSMQEWIEHGTIACKVPIDQRFDGEYNSKWSAVLDYVFGSTDTHDAGWMVRADGSPEQIDKGLGLPARASHDDYIDSRFLERHVANGDALPEDIQSIAKSWTALEGAAHRHQIEPEAIELAQRRFQALLSASNFADLPSLDGTGRISEQIAHSAQIRRQLMGEPEPVKPDQDNLQRHPEHEAATAKGGLA